MFSAGDKEKPFEPGNVLDAICGVTNYHELGLRLGIPDHQIAKIGQSPVQDRQQLFVAALFQSAPKENCNWEAVRSAMKHVRTQEWVVQKQSSVTKSVSMDSERSLISAGEFLCVYVCVCVQLHIVHTMHNYDIIVHMCVRVCVCVHMYLFMCVVCVHACMRTFN